MSFVFVLFLISEHGICTYLDRQIHDENLTEHKRKTDRPRHTATQTQIRSRQLTQTTGEKQADRLIYTTMQTQINNEKLAHTISERQTNPVTQLHRESCSDQIIHTHRDGDIQNAQTKDAQRQANPDTGRMTQTHNQTDTYAIAN